MLLVVIFLDIMFTFCLDASDNMALGKLMQSLYEKLSDLPVISKTTSKQTSSVMRSQRPRSDGFTELIESYALQAELDD